MAHIVMAYIVVAYTVMALYSYGLGEGADPFWEFTASNGSDVNCDESTFGRDPYD